MTVELRGMPELEKKLGHALDPVRHMAEEIAAELEKNVEQVAAPHLADRGIGLGEIKHDIAPGGVPLWAKVSTDNPVVIAIDRGRRPGGRMPPLEAIARWVEHHSLTPVAGRGRDLAWMVARAIQRRGLKGVRMFEKGARATEEKLPGIIAKTEDEIERKWG